MAASRFPAPATFCAHAAWSHAPVASAWRRALGAERALRPVRTLTAILVACSRVCWKLAQPALHPFPSPVERTLGGVIWAVSQLRRSS
jgi:hypothetical protein